MLTVHTVLLVGFVSVTVLLMLVTLANRMRVRSVLQTWQRPGWHQASLWPGLFIGATLLLFSYSLVAGHEVPLLLFAGYTLGGLFWLVATRLASAILVTECGLISHVNRQAVAWGQIVDYFENTRGKQQVYVFFYLGEDGVRRRLTLSVPPGHQERFARIVNDQLDARFECAMQQAYGKKALEG